MLGKRLENLAKGEGKDYLSEADRQTLQGRRQAVATELEGLDRARAPEDLSDQLARLRRERELLRLQIEDDMLANEYNHLKDAILSSKDDLSEYKRNLTLAI